MTKRPLRLAALLAAPALLLTGCVDNDSNSGSGDGTNEATGSIAVEITDDTCAVSSNEVPSGNVTFEITQSGTIRNEFEILADDQLRIISERENLTPGTTTELVVAMQPGTYYTACKLNMMGEPVGLAEFTVTDSGEEIEISEDRAAQEQAASEGYVAYVRSQVGELLGATEAFAELYKSKDDEQARTDYPLARSHYERIEANVEPWVDLDIAIDYRQVNAEEEGEDWTGWHVIEKDLWYNVDNPDLSEDAKQGYADYTPLTDDQRTEVADQLVADTQSLYDLVYSDEFAESTQIAEISNGAINLLEEVAGSKITGEEELWSQTDLYDFEANVQGAQVAYGYVKDMAEETEPGSTEKIDTAFTNMFDVLHQYGSLEDGYPAYGSLTDDQVKELSDTLNALRLEMGDLTHNVLQMNAEDE